MPDGGRRGDRDHDAVGRGVRVPNNGNARAGRAHDGARAPARDEPAAQLGQNRPAAQPAGAVPGPLNGNGAGGQLPGNDNAAGEAAPNQ